MITLKALYSVVSVIIKAFVLGANLSYSLLSKNENVDERKPCAINNKEKVINCKRANRRKEPVHRERLTVLIHYLR